MFDEEKKIINMPSEETVDDHSTLVEPVDDGHSTLVEPVDDGHSTLVEPVDDDHSTLTDNKQPSTPQEIIDLTGKEIDGYKIESRISFDPSSQGHLYLASKDGAHFAFKVYKRGSQYEPKPEVLKFLTDDTKVHKNIIKVLQFGKCNKGNNLYVVMKYYKNGSIANNFKHFSSLASQDLPAFQKYVEQLNEGLHFIHENNICHWDIKPQNILIDDDFKTLVITDFGSALLFSDNKVLDARKMDKRFTGAYIAPEGDTTLSPKVDYYALGVTIMEMAHGDTVPVIDNGLSQNKTGNWFIPKNVSPQIRGLIVNLRKFHIERIEYEGIKKWLKNPDYYIKDSNLHTLKDSFARYYLDFESRTFDGSIAKDTGDFIKKMQSNWAKSRDLFTSGDIFYVLNDASDYNPEKDTYFKNLVNKYKDNNPDLGLLFLFLKIDPDSEFVFINKNYQNAEIYLKNYFCKDINEFFDYEYLHERTIAEGISLLSKLEEIHKLAVEPKNASRYGTDNFERVCLYNLYSEERIAFINNKQKVVLSNLMSEIDNYLFDGKLNPFPLDFIFEPFFLETILQKYEFDDEQVLKLKEVWSIKNDPFVRNAKLALVFTTNTVRFKLEGVVIDNMMDFVKEAEKAVDNNEEKKIKTAAFLIKSNRLAKWYSLLPEVDVKILEELKKMVGSPKKDDELVTQFVNLASGRESFRIGGLVIRTVEQVFNYIANAPDMAKAVRELQQNKEFLQWLDAMGFSEAKDEILKI